MPAEAIASSTVWIALSRGSTSAAERVSNVGLIRPDLSRLIGAPERPTISIRLVGGAEAQLLVEEHPPADVLGDRQPGLPVEELRQGARPADRPHPGNRVVRVSRSSQNDHTRRPSNSTSIARSPKPHRAIPSSSTRRTPARVAITGSSRGSSEWVIRCQSMSTWAYGSTCPRATILATVSSWGLLLGKFSYQKSMNLWYFIVGARRVRIPKFSSETAA